jgi:hypothetical protein
VVALKRAAFAEVDRWEKGEEKWHERSMGGVGGLGSLPLGLIYDPESGCLATGVF